MSRQEQDEFAAECFARAKAAVASGAFDAEIVPVQARSGDPLLPPQEISPPHVLACAEARHGSSLSKVSKGKAQATVSADETAAKGSTLEQLSKRAQRHAPARVSVRLGRDAHTT